jgi:capping protein beta
MSRTGPNEPSGSWDSIHVFETAERGRQAHYKLTSTVMLQLITRRGEEGEAEGNSNPREEGWNREGEVNLSGSMTRQVGLLWFSLRQDQHCRHHSLDRAGLATP